MLAGYLNAVDFEEFDDDNNSKRSRARRNVVTVVLVYNTVFHSLLLKTCVNECSRRIRRCCFRCSRNLLDDILQFIFYDYRHSMQRICHRLHFLLYWHIVEEALIANLVHFVDELAPGIAITVSSVESVLSKYSPTHIIL